MKFSKIFTTTAVALGATLALSGCIRETFPKESAITENQLMTGDASAVLETLLPGVHAGLISTAGGYEHTDYGYFAQGVYHDYECKNCVANGWTIGNNTYYNRFYTAEYAVGYAPTSLMAAMTWMAYYPTIRSCNQIIGLAGDNDDYTKFRGMAKAYRAMLYLDLARLYDPLYAETKESYAATYEEGCITAQGLTVPIVTEETTEDSAKNNPRATREEMFNFIFADLADAEACLEGYVQEKAFFPTQAVVYGLYARAYMWLGCADFEDDGFSGELPTGKAAYALALEYAKKAIAAKGGAIMSKAEWTDPIQGFNTFASSWMMAVVNSSDTLISNLHQHPAHLAPEAMYGYCQYTSPGVSKLVYDNLNDTDFRKQLIKGPNTTLADFPYTTIKDEATFKLLAPYTFFKFRPGNGAQTDSTVGGSVTLPLMRCEEMYFIEMEATYHTLGDAAARDLLIAFMANRDTNYNFYRLGSEVLDEIIAQKALEFWGEGLVMYDMKRLDKGVKCNFEGTNYSELGRFNSKGRLPWWTYTIPTAELERNQGIEYNNPDGTQALDPASSFE